MKSHSKILKDNLNNDATFLKKLKFDKLIDTIHQPTGKPMGLSKTIFCLDANTGLGE